MAPYAGALELDAAQVDGSVIVVGRNRDDSVFRVYQVTKRSDGWWPDGFTQCRV